MAALATSSEGVSPEALAQHMVARVGEEDGGWVMEGKLMHDIELFIFVVHCLFLLLFLTIVIVDHCLSLTIVVFHHCYFSPL